MVLCSVGFKISIALTLGEGRLWYTDDGVDVGVVSGLVHFVQLGRVDVDVVDFFLVLV